MSDLAIKGHKTRGKEVIELLEMLGGKSNSNMKGYNDDLYYYIAKDGLIYGSGIEYDEFASNYTIFTLEEFLEKYPYKVGDEVEFKSIGDANLKSKIIYMEWCNSLNKVLYTTEDAQVISTEDIIETKSFPPYMDYDIKENKEKKINQMSLANCDLDEVEIVLGDKFELKIREGKYYAIRKKILYPKTYEECCECLSLGEDSKLYTKGYKASLIQDFQKLIICRDAYWKIAGEQMGLDKPWKYDMSKNEFSCAISYEYGSIQKCEVRYRNHFLVFPTAEMRDEFYKNFKELIEQCKELL